VVGIGGGADGGQNRAFKRFRLVPLLVAGGIGYLLGGWHITALRSTALSPSQSVALRFPDRGPSDQSADATLPATPGAIKVADAEPATMAGSGMLAGNSELALLNPERWCRYGSPFNRRHHSRRRPSHRNNKLPRRKMRRRKPRQQRKAPAPPRRRRPGPG